MHGQDGASTLMSIRDAARASGLSPKALRRRIERGTLGSVLVGGRRRIPVDDLVRRGLVPGAAGSPAAEPAVELHDPATLARRLRALEARVAALEAMLDGIASPVATARVVDSQIVGADSLPALVADPARLRSAD